MLRARRRTWFATRLQRAIAITGAVVFVAGGSVAFASLASAADSSAVTLTTANLDLDPATAPFPDLEVTISQTAGLEAQGIVLNWKGGKKSTVPNQQIGGTNFLQVFQCWGDLLDADGKPLLDAKGNRQPDRTTCQYGGTGNAGSSRDDFRPNDESVAKEDAMYTAPGDGFANPTYTSIPFRSVGGETIASVVDNKKVNVDVNTNQYFTKYTTNMIPWAGSGGDGTGSVKFELQTAMQSKGLGCGAAVTSTDGTVSGASCWLVVLPRGTADSGATNITQSGLFWDAWKHRLAVKMDFKPLGARCPIGAAERQLAGSELVSRAVASWQPVVCNEPGGAVYSAISSAESDAALAANEKAPAPLALTSRPVSTELGPDSLRYAPVAITGAAISFAVDRNPRPGDPSVPAEAENRGGLPFSSLKLTPRLVAKLLTNSYLDSLPTFADRDHLSHTSEGAKVFNPRSLTTDPDFMAINDPEWGYQALASPSLADLLSPQGRSDAAWAVWQYVLSDPAAVDFLNGKPDPWGMTVNPWSSTDASVNKTGAPLTLPREDFPKADPVEQAATSSAGPVNLVTWRPYVNDFDSGAYLTLRGDGQILGAWDPTNMPPKYGKADRSLPGRQTVLAMTDTASAARYQVVSAALLNPAGEYVTASPDSMLAAAAAMTVSSTQSQVYGFDPSSDSAKGARSAYPLTMPVYAATNPLMPDAGLRASYASFIRFASTTGQQPGTSLGQLPEGFAELPESWKAQAAAAADDIEAGRLPVVVTPTTAPIASTSIVNAPASAPRAAAPAPAAASAAEASPPSAVGNTAAPLSGATTPEDPEPGAMAAIIPASVLGAAACAIAVPLVSRRRRLL
jgi:hypothetical protein